MNDEWVTVQYFSNVHYYSVSFKLSHKSLYFTNYFSDIDECSSEPCLNSVSCDDEVNRYHCTCVEGYTGTHCETGQSEHCHIERTK